MFTIIMLALIALVALVILVKGAANVDGDTYRIRWIGWVLLGIGFAWLLLSKIGRAHV